MPSEPLRVLCIHGVNTPEVATRWQDDWTRAIEMGIHRWQPDRTVDLNYLRYDHLGACAAPQERYRTSSISPGKVQRNRRACRRY